MESKLWSHYLSPEKGHAISALVLVFLALVLWLGWSLYADVFGTGFRAADFNYFHSVATIAQQSRLVEAYGLGSLDPMDILGTPEPQEQPVFTYPPQFVFFLYPLGGLTRATAFAIFVGGSLALYLYVLARLSGEYLTAVLAAALPVLATTVLNGQTSLLVGALAGLYCLGALSASRWAAVPLGMMVIKPHLALGFAVEAVVGRRWRTVAVASATVAASFLLATLAFGTDVWGAFLQSASQTGERLEGGGFKLYRMTSVYALGVTVGLSQGAALIVHLSAAGLAVLAMVAAVASTASPRIRLGVAAIASLMFSPYVYEYDLTILFLGLALLWGDLVIRSRPWERLLIVVAAWCATFNLFFDNFVPPQGFPHRDTADAAGVLAVHAIAYLTVAALVMIVLLRAPRPKLAGAA